MPGKIVTPEEWRTARIDLLKKEKAHTREADSLARARAAMPTLEVKKEYTFDSPSGKISLSDMFKNRPQLLVYHFMFDPSWSAPCSSCSFLVDQMPRPLTHLEARGTTLAFVSRAPVEKLEAAKKRLGWEHIDWYSSGDSSFNYDYHVSLDEAVAPVEYNFASKEVLEGKGMEYATKGEQPGFSVFVKGEEGQILHSYSCYGRGPDHLLTTYGLLDLTPRGRGDGTRASEVPEEGLGFRLNDEY